MINKPANSKRGGRAVTLLYFKECCTGRVKNWRCAKPLPMGDPVVPTGQVSKACRELAERVQ